MIDPGAQPVYRYVIPGMAPAETGRPTGGWEVAAARPRPPRRAHRIRKRASVRWLSGPDASNTKATQVRALRRSTHARHLDLMGVNPGLTSERLPARGAGVRNPAERPPSSAMRARSLAAWYGDPPGTRTLPSSAPQPATLSSSVHLRDLGNCGALAPCRANRISLVLRPDCR